MSLTEVCKGLLFSAISSGDPGLHKGKIEYSLITVRLEICRSHESNSGLCIRDRRDEARLRFLERCQPQVFPGPRQTAE